MNKILKYVFFLFILQIINSKIAFAYLDPGAGSFIYQVLISFIISGIFAIKIFWIKIKKIFSGLIKFKK